MLKTTVPTVKQLLPSITDEETFNFATYLLAETEDFEEDILPFTDNANPQIRSTAYYTLGESKKKNNTSIPSSKGYKILTIMYSE